MLRFVRAECNTEVQSTISPIQTKSKMSQCNFFPPKQSETIVGGSYYVAPATIKPVYRVHKNFGFYCGLHSSCRGSRERVCGPTAPPSRWASARASRSPSVSSASPACRAPPLLQNAGLLESPAFVIHGSIDLMKGLFKVSEVVLACPI